MSNTVMRLVRVTWRMASVSDPDKDVPCESVGYVVEIDARKVTLCATRALDDSELHHKLTIPMRLVDHISTIAEPE